MSPQDTLDRVAELLGFLPGTKVERHWCSEADAHLYLEVESFDSLATIVRHAMFANSSVGVRFVGPPGPCGDTSEAKKLQFQLRLAAVDPDPPSTLEMFGIYLVRHAKAAGLVPPQYADELQRRWNAAVM